MYELWAGERLSLEKAHPRYLRPGRQFQCRLFLLVQALIFGALVGSLCLDEVSLFAAWRAWSVLPLLYWC